MFSSPSIAIVVTIARWFVPNVGLSLHFFQNIRSFHILSRVKIPAPNGVLTLGRWLIAPKMRVCTRADHFFRTRITTRSEIHF